MSSVGFILFKMKVPSTVFIKLLLFASFMICILLFYTNESGVHRKIVHNMKNYWKPRESVIIIVGCGAKYVTSIITVIRSALQCAKPSEKLTFEIFCDSEQRSNITKGLEIFRNYRDFTVNMHNPSFPEKNRGMWEKMFAKCASQRLFVANLLKDVDAAIYVDSDVLFVASPGEMFETFGKFSDRQIAGMVFNSYGNQSWYPEVAVNPFYGEFGLNAGVIFMNLSRMRENKFEEKIMAVMEEFKNSGFRWGDQCLLNTYFKYHPQELYELPCGYNFRTDLCQKYSRPNLTSLKILHGNRGIFQNPYSTFYALSNFLLNVSPSSNFFLEKPSILIS